MLAIGDRVIVCVSGGPDSMALLFALHQLQDDYQLSLWGSHYNHKLRGKESDQEAEFVKCQAERIGIPLLVEDDNGSLLKTKGNLEETARNKRYAFFQKKTLELNAQKVALGHTATDQAETFFLWLFRGVGTKGLGCIPPVRDNLIIRPLIETEREEIIGFLKEKGIPWKEDPTNKAGNFLRNRVRRILIPKLLKEFDPHLVKKIIKTTEIFRDDDIFLEKLTLDKLNEISIKNDKTNVLLDINKLEVLPVSLKRRVIRYALKTIQGALRRVNFDHVESILKLIKSHQPHSQISLPYEIEVYKEYNRLRFARALKETISFYYEAYKVPEIIIIPEIERKITITTLDWDQNNSPLTEKNVALIDFEKINFPLVVRNWKRGDRFQPLGTQGSKKVKDFFIDLKIPRIERKQVPLVLCGDQIAWIAGLRVDEKVKITQSTKKVVKMVII
ncbi:MAG: tRNA lysidine(34) synthetase TilS [Thermodesulfobacteriota bacterium]|nr:MAG: tRNA lysidine(34) synthetase TilS [Thermodesulfobacteriota bacterium]